MRLFPCSTLLLAPCFALLHVGCGGEDSSGSPTAGTGGSGGASASGGAAPTGGAQSGGAQSGGGQSAGGSSSVGASTLLSGDGSCVTPADAAAEDVSAPTTVVGTGTKESCTSAAVVAAVAGGGVITFNCGPDPMTITLEETAKVFNDKGPKIVIDGGNKVTLSGGGTRRVLYMNTCDPNQVYTTPHCDNQDHPRLTVQHLTIVEGNAKGLDPAGGGAIYAQGGRLKLVDVQFKRNVCDDTGQDVGGGAVRAFQQSDNLPIYVVGSKFGGSAEDGNVCSNGAGLSSIGVNWHVIDSDFSFNQAIGNGKNPAAPGTPGGGQGAAIYNDGNTISLRLCNVRINDNKANELGAAIFFVSNNLTGDVLIANSTLTNNSGLDVQKFQGLYVEARDKSGDAGISVVGPALPLR